MVILSVHHDQDIEKKKKMALKFKAICSLCNIQHSPFVILKITYRLDNIETIL